MQASYHKVPGAKLDLAGVQRFCLHRLAPHHPVWARDGTPRAGDGTDVDNGSGNPPGAAEPGETADARRDADGREIRGNDDIRGGGGGGRRRDDKTRVTFAQELARGARLKQILGSGQGRRNFDSQAQLLQSQLRRRPAGKGKRPGLVRLGWRIPVDLAPRAGAVPR